VHVLAHGRNLLFHQIVSLLLIFEHHLHELELALHKALLGQFVGLRGRSNVSVGVRDGRISFGRADRKTTSKPRRMVNRFHDVLAA
jgi:hypothetical protein